MLYSKDKEEMMQFDLAFLAATSVIAALVTLGYWPLRRAGYLSRNEFLAIPLGVMLVGIILAVVLA